MKRLVAETLTGLAAAVRDLKARVRAAVALEMSRYVAAAVGDVVRAVVAGTPTDDRSASRPAYPGHSRPYWPDDEGGDGDPWSHPGDGWDDDPDDSVPESPARPAAPDRPSIDHSSWASAAVAAGVGVARWWLLRRGTRLAAAGLGLGVGLIGVAGGPVGRAAVAVLAAALDLVLTADALGDPAARPDSP